MKKSSLILMPLISLFAAVTIIGTAFAAWTTNEGAVEDAARVEIIDWDFGEISDSAHIENVSMGNLSYLTAERETTILSDYHTSIEAIRLTNTAGTQTKDHSFNINLDRDYYLREIAIKKVEFDYYHAEKRQQAGKGFPWVQLLYNNSGKGNTYGGGDTISPQSVYLSTDSADGKWWHLEYFITALCPTMADHGDTGISPNQKINGIKILDKAIYDYDDKTAFVVVDNLKLTATSSTRLGIFNKGTSFKVGNYYWMKIAWSGELQYVNIEFTELDGTPTNEYADFTPSEKSPFYLYGKKAGQFYAIATLIVGGGQPLTISNKLTVTT